VLDPSAITDDPATNLQLGLAVELSVLPPYLYALWSLKPVGEGASPAAVEAANTMRAVVYEEMLHAALVGNILNALGTPPDVTGQLMSYPGPLPGHITKGPYAYEVSLAPVCVETIDTFKKIELPDWVKPELIDDGWKTIADLYAEVKAGLRRTNPSLRALRQLPPGDNPGPGRMIQVKDLTTAFEAIDTIVDQGEGHQQKKPDDPPEGIDDDHEMAHYEQFVAIAGYLDDGSIDPDRDVYPLISDPDASMYDPDQQAANGQFNEAYTALLDSLKQMWQSDAPRAFGEPTSAMNRLAHLAAVLRSTGSIPGMDRLPGPTFEYGGAGSRGAH
jgi:hypothetical protein